ncbi:MAG: HAD hydrolase-like protein [Parasporobacterium sp.]|nr:HAD hydrolase-like protein [Parasporobacterium sp.]
MFRKFYPTVYSESAYTVDFGLLYEKGFRGLLTDVDNTLVPHDAPSTVQAEELFRKLRDTGFKICIISNNDEARVKTFADRVGAPYVFKASKPSATGYLRGMEITGTDISDTIFMGDQLFTDIWGANNARIPSVLVKPIRTDHKFLILLKRAGEAIVKLFYFRYAAKHKTELQKLLEK